MRIPGRKHCGFYDFRTNQHFTLKTNPLKQSDLDDFVSCFNPKNRFERKETARFRPFQYEELLKRDRMNLDILWLKDEKSLEIGIKINIDVTQQFVVTFQ